MLTKSRLFLLGSLSLLSVACATSNNATDDQGDQQDNKNEPGYLDLIICEEPRPQACTREYNPVCATLQNGSTKTDSTGCTSCSDPEVVGYKMGACGIVSLEESASGTP